MDNLVVHRVSDQAVLRLEGDLNFDMARELHGQLLSLFHAFPRVRLEIGNLGALDLVGLQLLYAAFVSASRLGIAFSLDAGQAGERLRKLQAFAGLPPLPEDRHGD